MNDEEEENKEKGGAGGEKKMKVKTETTEQNYCSFMMSSYLMTWGAKGIERTQ